MFKKPIVVTQEVPSRMSRVLPGPRDIAVQSIAVLGGVWFCKIYCPGEVDK